MRIGKIIFLAFIIPSVWKVCQGKKYVEEEAESSQIFYGNLAISRGLQLTRRGRRLSRLL